MPFLPRNCYYLRVSSSLILPLYHVDWMSDRVLHQVVADLRPKIIQKLRAESDAHMGPGLTPTNVKKGTVDVHRGDTYQFAYFLRETEPHSVLIKTRNFVLDTQPLLPASSSTSREETDQRKGSSVKQGKHKSSFVRTNKPQTREDKVTPKNYEGEDSRNSFPRGSEHVDSRGSQADGDENFDIGEDLDTGNGTTNEAHWTTGITTDTNVKVEEGGTLIEIGDDDEPKPKLTLELQYRAFTNFKRCLCVVVEPWPPQRLDTRAPLHTPSAVTRTTSGVAPANLESRTSLVQRAKTPLFLPSDVDDEPALSLSRLETLPSAPLFDEPRTGRDADHVVELDDSDALMQFSQILGATGRVSGADVEEDDEFDGAALFADADETKEL
ncbi:hypothetical protein B0F90DRAFT_549097 [Multifurca ochricompacta]|uniref:Uncharacterized protein n=1 Tax=Multifurca ochricompacta TaxID=376703 RepID=A0AAD4MC12_9AGAM|nr:hypothetical protein B0F90DRAFT_549097 [Multifurca ochricompacta]